MAQSGPSRDPEDPPETDPTPQDPTPQDLTPLDPVPPSDSSLTTLQLQLNLRAVKQRERPVRLLFEIPSARIVEHALSRHVVYEVVVMRSGSFDSRRVAVERRYSDFLRFHQRLQEELQEELQEALQEAQLPRRLLTGNFSPETIAERRLALQDYLARLFAVRRARRSPHFAEFFTLAEQRRAHALLRGGQFQRAAQQLQLVLEVQEKLLPWQKPTLLVPTLCAVAVCHRDLDQSEQAFAAAQRALPPVRRYGLTRYRGALLQLLVDLGYPLGRPVARLQEELRLLRDGERGEVPPRSLKEVVIHQFT